MDEWKWAELLSYQLLSCCLLPEKPWYMHESQLKKLQDFQNNTAVAQLLYKDGQIKHFHH